MFRKINKYFYLSSFLIFLQACSMVGPNFRSPCVTMSETWDVEGGNSIIQGRAEACDWWEVLNDPVLNDLIYRAYNQNLSLTIAGLKVYEARAILGIATGSLYPQQQELAADFSTIRTSEPNPDRYFNELSLGFDAIWELDIWGKYRRGVQASAANLVANVANYHDVKVSLSAEVARIYVVIRSLQERIEIAKENASIQERILEITEVLYEGGTESRLDAYQATILLENTLALIPRYEKALNQSLNALSVLLDMPTAILRQIVTETPAKLPTPPGDIAIGIPADLLRRRPDIRQAEYEALAQCSLIGIAKSELYPSLTLLGSLGWTATDMAGKSLGNLFNSSNYEYQFGPSVRWNLFNYGRLKNQVRVEDARFEQLLVNYHNKVLEAVSEVQDASVSFIKSKEEAEIIERSVEAASRALAISTERYIEGLSSYQRVLDTSRSLIEQQDLYVQASTEALTSLIAIYKSLGGGWQTPYHNDFAPQCVKCHMKKRTDWGLLLQERNPEVTGHKAICQPIRKPDW